MTLAQRLNRLLGEATEERDAEARAEADALWAVLWPLLQSFRRYGDASPATVGNEVYGYNVPVRGVVGLVTRTFVNVETRAVPGLDRYDLRIQVEVPGRVSSGAAGSFGLSRKDDKPTILLSPLRWTEDALREPFDHEFTHFKDFLRSKHWKSLNHDRGDGPEMRQKRYYNNPREFNAFYQEAAGRVARSFRAALEKADDPGAFVRLYADFGLKSFEEFQRAFETQNFGSREWFSGMDDRYRKKYRVRLYNLFGALRGEADAAIERAKKEGRL